MLIGSHLSTAGGVGQAPIKAVETDCECFQIFTKSQLQWKSKPLESDQVIHWYEEWENAGWSPCFIHDSYLINLASPEDSLREKSVEAFVDELERAEILGIPWVNTHPGSHRGAGEQVGLDNCVRSLKEVLERTADLEVGILLENTAGQGNDLGSRFEQLAYMLKGVSGNRRVGVCMDTCHAFAAGYDFSDKSYEATWKQFDSIVGIDRLHAFHLNDSRYPLGSARDRHAEIGTGHLGEEAFTNLVRDPRFDKLMGVCELPEEGGVTTRSIALLKKLRG